MFVTIDGQIVETSDRSRDVMGLSLGGITKSIGKAAKGAVKSVGRTASGVAKGVTGAGKAIVTGKPKEAAKQLGRAVTAVTSNPVVQAGWPGTIPVHVAAGLATGGVKGAVRNAKQAGTNPAVRAEMAAASIIFPPVAPVMGAAIAATEGAARLNSALISKNPLKIGQAVTAMAGTAALAAGGNSAAARTLATVGKVGGVMNVVAGLKTGSVPAKKAVAGAKGNAKALGQILQTRDALKGLKSPSAATRAAATGLISKLQLSNPQLLAGVQAGINVPERISFERFDVLRTGRILLDGKPVRKAVIGLAAFSHR